MVPQHGGHHLVSVITPSYNHALYIRQTIESVLAQDYPHVEHIVVDGASTDGTVEILREYGERFPDRFRWVSEKDNGQAHALNKGIAMARGEFIGWQNSDDYYLPRVFAEPIRYLCAHPDVAVVFSECQMVDGSGVVTGAWPVGPFEYGRLLQFCCVANQAAFIRRDALLACGGVSESQHYTMDYDLWLRLGLTHRFHFVPGLRGAFRQLPDAKSHHGLLMNRVEWVTAVEQAVSSPLLPPELLTFGRTMLQRHILDALLVALAYDERTCAAEMLEKAVRYDHQLALWPYFCRRLLMRRVLPRTWYGHVGADRVGAVPRRILPLLTSAGQVGTPAVRQTVSLFHLFQALRDDPAPAPRAARAHLLRALQVDRHFLRYPATAIALLQLVGGARSVYRLQPIFDRLRAVSDRRAGRRRVGRQ